MDERYFIDIVNKFISGEKYIPANDINWFKIMELAKTHNMEGIVGLVINKSNITDIPLECYEFFDFMVFDCARCGIMWEMKFKEVTDVLSNAGIKHIIVKGYLLKNLYPEKDMRTMCDLDFVLRKEDMEKAKTAMENAGFKYEDSFDGDWRYVKDGANIEFHEGILNSDTGMGNVDFEEYMKQAFDRTVPMKGESSCTFELDNDFHYIYIILHAMRHFYGFGFGVRMLLDIALFIKYNSEKMDWEYINNEFSKLKCDRFANNMIALSYRFFNIGKKDINAEIINDEKLYNEVFEFIMNGGFFKGSDFDGAKRSRDRLARNESILKVYFKRAFPSDDITRGLIKWYKDKPKILLPAAWVYKWFNAIFRKKGALVHAIIQTAENKNSKRQLEILKKVGLYEK